MWVCSRERRKREGSTANGRGMKGGGGILAIMNGDEGEKVIKQLRRISGSIGGSGGGGGLVKKSSRRKSV